MAQILQRASPITNIFNHRVIVKFEKRFLSSVPRSRRGEVPPSNSWFSRSTENVLAEGQATGKQIRNAFGVACGIQLSFTIVSMTVEALCEQWGSPIPAEIPSGISLIGFVGSGFAFRKYLKPNWAKIRWYFLLPPMALGSIIFSAFFVRTILIPEPPPLPENEAEEIKNISNALNLKCFEGNVTLTLEACTMAWSKLFARACDVRGLLTVQSIRSCDVNDPIVRACGVDRLISFLQQPENNFALQGLFNVVCAGKDSVGMKEFAMLMLAVQSAYEGQNDHQCELLFRLMNTSGHGHLSQSEFLRWLELLMSNETSAAAFDNDRIQDRRGIFGVSQVKLSTVELAKDYFFKYDKKRKGYLSFLEFKEYCEASNIRFAARICLAHLVMEASPILMAGQLLQFLMLNPAAGVLRIQSNENSSSEPAK